MPIVLSKPNWRFNPALPQNILVFIGCENNQFLNKEIFITIWICCEGNSQAGYATWCNIRSLWSEMRAVNKLNLSNVKTLWKKEIKGVLRRCALISIWSCWSFEEGVVMIKPAWIEHHVGNIISWNTDARPWHVQWR